MEVSQKLKIELPYDLPIQLLAVYLKNKQAKLIPKDTYIPMFRAALLVIAKIWKKSKSLSTDKWIKRSSIHTYGGILCNH